jgi:hypothetical protein
MRLPLKIIALFAFLFLSFATTPSYSQPLGFGCLGLSGFFAGYSQQSYEVPGINDYVNKQIFLIDPGLTGLIGQVKFQKVTGYRIGANIFRGKIGSFFLTAKGYYQFVKEQQDISNPDQTSQIRQSYQLSMNHWGVGIDLGVKLFWVLDWKIIEGNLLVFDPEFSQEVFQNNVSAGQVKFDPDKSKLGYFIGSGFILHIVPDYISVEGSAGYNFLTIDQMKNDSGTPIPVLSSTLKAVEKGGLSVTLQLNIGFPL